MRITIGNKVFAIAASMTLIVALTAVASAYYVGNANDQVQRVAETYIPLSNVIEDIEDHILEQEILFERLAPRLRAREVAARVDPVLQEYQEHGEEVQKAFQTGLKLLRQAQEAEHFIDFKVELARLATLLEQVVRMQRDLQQQSGAILDRLGSQNAANIEGLLAARLKLDLELERQIAVITTEVDALTDRAARNVAEAEIWALRANIAATIAAALFGLIMAGLIARGLVRPIHKLVDAAREVERGNLSPQLEVRSNDEIGNLTQAFKDMSAELLIKEQIKDTFGKYVDPRVVESVTTGQDAGLGDGERRVYSVFFSDIAGFTGISELLTPKALVNLINAYLSEMSLPIQESSGVIDKYIGDAIMAYWGPPFTPAEEHAQAACRAALEQQARLANFRTRVGEITGLRRDYPDISMRIGIATGEVLVGSVGSETIRNYTVIGDTVNLAARLESLGKHYGVAILISEGSWQAVRDDFESREIDTIAVAGKTEPVRIFELLAAKGELTPERAALRDHFHVALENYRSGDWPAARHGLSDCLAQDPADGPSQVMLDRLETLETATPPNWDGVWRFTQK